MQETVLLEVDIIQHVLKNNKIKTEKDLRQTILIKKNHLFILLYDLGKVMMANDIRTFHKRRVIQNV